MTSNVKVMPRAAHAHVLSDMEHVSKDAIIVVDGPYASGTVLGLLNNGHYKQLDIAEGAAEAHEAVTVLLGRIDNAEPTAANGHSRVCALMADRITWPSAITAERKKTEVARLAANQVVLR